METSMDVDNLSDRGQQIQQQSDMVVNSAGGYVWEVSDIQRLKRFLVLGSENGTYYTSAKALGFENVRSISKLISEGRGPEVVEIIRFYSVEGRCPKQNAIVYCLALCARFHDEKRRFADSRKAAYEALPEVCRTPTDLFHFVRACEEISKAIDNKTGWGRAHRNAISKWYCGKHPQSLAYHVTKYKQRNGWTHTDLLRLCHAKAGDNKALQAVFKFVVKGYEEMMESVKDIKPMDQQLSDVIGYLTATEKAQKAQNEDDLLQVMQHHELVREHIPTSLLSSIKVWRQLLTKMPLNALIRNLGKMSSIGMFINDGMHQGEEIAITVAQTITNEELLKKAKIHPFNILLALNVYNKGKGEKGSNKWSINAEIVQALNKAYYLAFKFVEPTKKRYLLGIDVSGSMSYSGCSGAEGITPLVAAAAMAMVTLRKEEKAYPMAFSDSLIPLDINKEMTLEQVLKSVERMTFGATDCALPMIYALENKIAVDVFIVYTDSETWIGDIHPFQALKNYRDGMGIADAKLIVCAMTSTGFTIADPSDPNMLDIVGFDSAAPEIIAKFSMGEI